MSSGRYLYAKASHPAPLHLIHTDSYAIQRLSTSDTVTIMRFGAEGISAVEASLNSFELPCQRQTGGLREAWYHYQ